MEISRDQTILLKAFPQSLSTDVETVLELVPPAQHAPHLDIGTIFVAGESLHIPFRIYSPEPTADKLATLVGKQPAILACLYTRHHDGYVRHRHLRDLLALNEAWVPPFVLQLVGEYVVQIIKDIESNSAALDSKHYSRFIADNPDFVARTKQRIISYWRYNMDTIPLFEDYPGFKIADKLKLWKKNDARKLRRM